MHFSGKSTLFLSALGFTLSTMSSCTQCGKSNSEEAKPSEIGSTAPTTEASAAPEVKELKIETLKEGSGNITAVSGKKITVHYTGRLTDGKVFDSSEQRQSPFAFILGSGQVIQGWEKGISGMKIGERRRLTIPPHLAYGDKSIGNVIPSKSTLVFEVELLNVE